MLPPPLPVISIDTGISMRLAGCDRRGRRRALRLAAEDEIVVLVLNVAGGWLHGDPRPDAVPDPAGTGDADRPKVEIGEKRPEKRPADAPVARSAASLGARGRDAKASAGTVGAADGSFSGSRCMTGLHDVAILLAFKRSINVSQVFSVAGFGAGGGAAASTFHQRTGHSSSRSSLCLN